MFDVSTLKMSSFGDDVHIIRGFVPEGGIRGVRKGGVIGRISFQDVRRLFFQCLLEPRDGHFLLAYYYGGS